MRTRQGGFTLVELMITVALIGILAAIAMPAFMEYMKKSKLTEAELALDQMEKKATIFHLQKGTFPPQSNLLPTISACTSGTGKTVQVPQSTWQANAGWNALEFHQDEPGYFQYEWFNFGAGFAIAYAQADLDCNSANGMIYRIMISSQGNITTFPVDVMSAD